MDANDTPIRSMRSRVGPHTPVWSKETNMSNPNVKTIQTIYGAFGRGDLPTILEHSADGVEFSFNVAKSEVPWHATFKGKGELPKFFEALGAGTTIHSFEPVSFVGEGPNVVVAVRFEHTIKKTGRRLTENQVHWWTFDAYGRAARLVHYTNTSTALEAER